MPDYKISHSDNSRGKLIYPAKGNSRPALYISHMLFDKPLPQAYNPIYLLT